MKKIIIYTDGGARGNPGPAAVGVVIKLKTKHLTLNTDEGEIIMQFGKKIGETTNNVAEYTAVIEALKWLKGWVVGNESNPQPTTHNSFPFVIQFFLDSKLVVNQLNGLFKIKDAKLRELLFKVKELETEINGQIFYNLVPREENKLADSLVNKTLDCQ